MKKNQISMVPGQFFSLYFILSCSSRSYFLELYNPYDLLPYSSIFIFDEANGKAQVRDRNSSVALILSLRNVRLEYSEGQILPSRHHRCSITAKPSLHLQINI